MSLSTGSMVAARQNGKLDSRQTHETALDFRAPCY